ncbi:MAG: zf-HC2 domain-containing protein [Actinomycetota bacterium]
MDHESAERLISERLDGERLSPRALVALERHLESCAECRAFERGAWRLRESARFEVAPAVPDLVETIMASVETEAGRPRPGLRVVRPMLRPRRTRLLPRLAPGVAALLVGTIAGSLLVGGPWGEDAPERAAALAAEDVTRAVAGAATALTAYEATFAITEHDPSGEIAERRLRMQVWFRAPESFRLEVRDDTQYPSPATPTDLDLIVNGDDWYASAPAPCAKATCPQRAASVRNRVPFSSAAPAPTDLVLPLAALADPEDLTVLGHGTALGRRAVVVEEPFERAASLFPFLSIGGDWRPIYPGDRVRIWLEEESWLPLRWEVYPAGGHARDAWAQRFGLLAEPSRHAIFEVEALSIETSPPAASVFAVPATKRPQDQGARAVAFENVAAEAGFEPLAPQALGGLDRYRVTVSEMSGEALVTYADGLSFVKLAETRSWRAGSPFGSIDVRAEEVTLAGGGVAYYEPATTDQGRRLAIHAAGTDLFLETNLPREELLSAAAALPVVGLEMPEAWLTRSSDGAIVERVSLEEASAALGVPVVVPASLPPGFALASVELVRVDEAASVTLYLRDVDVDTGAGTIRLHLEPATELPPASSARQFPVQVAGADGRWTPRGSRLEWVADGLYRSLDAPGRGLDELLRVATSIPAEQR